MTYEKALAALADPSRRAIFQRLKSGPLAVIEISQSMPISRPAVSQHLKVLKEARLVAERSEGARHIYFIDPFGLAGLRRWLDQFWGDALEAFQADVEREPMKERKSKIMTPTVKVAPVIKTVRVKASKERAFEIFTAGMSRWWPPSHSISKTKSPLKEAIIEPRVGGRWYERGKDGSECEWGKVLAWEPPERLVLAWQINGQWQFDPSLVTEVEICFSSESGGITRVDLEHRNLDRFGDAAEAVRKVFDSPGGWLGLLDGFAKLVS